MTNKYKKKTKKEPPKMSCERHKNLSEKEKNKKQKRTK